MNAFILSWLTWWLLIMSTVMIIVHVGTEAILGMWASIFPVLRTNTTRVDIGLVVGTLDEVTLVINPVEEFLEVSL